VVGGGRLGFMGGFPGWGRAFVPVLVHGCVYARYVQTRARDVDVDDGRGHESVMGGPQDGAGAFVRVLVRAVHVRALRADTRARGADADDGRGHEPPPGVVRVCLCKVRVRALRADTHAGGCTCTTARPVMAGPVGHPWQSPPQAMLTGGCQG